MVLKQRLLCFLSLLCLLTAIFGSVAIEKFTQIINHFYCLLNNYYENIEQSAQRKKLTKLFSEASKNCVGEK